MTPLVLDSAETLTRFDAICSLIGAQRNGISLEQLRDAHALARELENPESGKSERVWELCRALDLELEDLQ